MKLPSGLEPLWRREFLLVSAIGKDVGKSILRPNWPANAWDIEIFGPGNFHWARRFSGEDRDVDVISEAVHAAVLDQAA